jgi:hypothetical protein
MSYNKHPENTQGKSSEATMEALAAKKKLPVEFLADLGIRNIKGGGVQIRYKDETGKHLLVRNRDIPGEPRFMQQKGKALQPYGLWRLDQARKEETLFLVEGESDCWAGWLHNRPMLGLPGSESAGCLRQEHVKGINNIYVLDEKDAGAPSFLAGVQKQLAAFRWPGKAFVLRMPESIKDIADLHTDDPERFDARLNAATIGAKPLAEQARAEAETALPFGWKEAVARAAKATEAPPTPVSVATAADLKRILGEQRWIWPRWIPAGVIVGIAAGEGVGKTRFVADLLRRIYLGLPWPDGTPAALPVGSKMMWCPCDNNYTELVSCPEAFGIPLDALLINANNTSRDEILGETLITRESIKALEARIALVRPAFLVIDTVTNATEIGTTKPEDAAAFYKPLQTLAAKYDFTILCLAHFNATGQVLGRRLKGIARIMIHLSQPDETQTDRRRLWVEKTFDIKPPPLGVTMSSTGNEYDTDPPEAPVGAEVPGKQKKGIGPKTKACADWLAERILDKKIKVAALRHEAEEKGWGQSTFYAAKRHLGLEEVEEKGNKWWFFKEVTDE